MNNSSASALIIINPKSGAGNVDLSIISHQAKKFGWQGKLVETGPQMTSGEIAQKAINEGITRIIVGGGDGTVREMLGAVVKSPVKIGIIPLGTGNIFAKNLHIPLDIKAAIRIALKGKIKKVDVGNANGNYFVLIAGMGLDVDAMAKTSQDLKSKIGALAYLWTGLKYLAKPPGRYQLIIDGGPSRFVRAKSILVANIGKTEAGLQVVPYANSQSGDFKIGVIKANTPASWVNLIFNTLRGTINHSPAYNLLEGCQVDIICLNGPRHFDCDGDVFPKTDKLHIRIYPQSLSVLVP